jgi:regulatory factor X
MPVQKLLGNPALAPWVEQCDFILYQLMMSNLSGLTLQVVPKPVMDTMKNITEKLVPHIRESFQGQPPHVIRAKETPAVLFTGLLDRALRVNLTAHAAANMLANPANRDQMYMDWISIVRLRRVAESVPTRGMDDLVSLLIDEMRNLINPTTVPWELECVTIYSEVANRSSRQLGGEDETNASETNVLDRWVEFLRGLPAKFPYASHADIVWAVERVGTSVMRDLTLAQGKSFGSWWVTKVWLDEMVWFMTMQGGFMKMQNSQITVAPASTQPQMATQETNAPTSSRSDDLNLSNLPDGQAGRAPFPPVNQTNQNTTGLSGGDSHDDSGIGIRTPEDDFPMEKFGFAEGQDQSVMTDTEL